MTNTSFLSYTSMANTTTSPGRASCHRVWSRGSRTRPTRRSTGPWRSCSCRCSLHARSLGPRSLYCSHLPSGNPCCRRGNRRPRARRKTTASPFSKTSLLRLRRRSRVKNVRGSCCSWRLLNCRSTSLPVRMPPRGSERPTCTGVFSTETLLLSQFNSDNNGQTATRQPSETLLEGDQLQKVRTSRLLNHAPASDSRPAVSMRACS